MAYDDSCIMHIRKPSALPIDIENLISKIDKEYYPRLTIHYNFDIAEHFNLGGIHLSAKSPIAPQNWSGRISASCHNFAEVERMTTSCDYVFLSPIFPSISKSGYDARFDNYELANAKACGIINDKVYALGGVTHEKISQIRAWGFGGFAVLGYIWNSGDTETILKRVAELNAEI